MERRTSPFTKSWLPTLKLIVAGIAATAIGVPLLLVGYSNMNPLMLIFGAAATISGPIMLISLPFAGRGGHGRCPVCETQIDVPGGRAQDLLCVGCGAYLDLEGDNLITIPHQRMHDTPYFAVPTPWPHIRRVLSSTIAFSAQDYIANVITDAIRKDKGTYVMDARWPPGCCVCGGPVKRRERFALTVTMPGNIRDSKAEIVVPNVPYCAEHKDGIDFANVTPDCDAYEERYAMRFRSHAFREAFRELNPWRWDGMIAAQPSAAATSPTRESADVETKVIVQCPQCAQKMRVPAGKKGHITCPACKGSFAAET